MRRVFVDYRVPQQVISADMERLLPLSNRTPAVPLIVRAAERFAAEVRAKIRANDSVPDGDLALMRHVEARVHELRKDFPFKIGADVAEVLFYFMKLGHVESLEDEKNTYCNPLRQERGESVTAWADRVAAHYAYLNGKQTYANSEEDQYLDREIRRATLFGLRQPLYDRVTKAMAFQDVTLIDGASSTGSKSVLLKVISLPAWIELADKENQHLAESPPAPARRNASGGTKPGARYPAINKKQWAKAYGNARVDPAKQDDPLR